MKRRFGYFGGGFRSGFGVLLMANCGGDLPLPALVKGAMLPAKLLLSGEFPRMILGSEPPAILGISEITKYLTCTPL